MQPVDRVTVTAVDENYIDMLLPDLPGVTRTGLPHHFNPKKTPVLAEAGLSLHVEVGTRSSTARVLFDTGLTSSVLLHNLGALGLDPTAIDHIVVSHGHPDHHGGLAGLLDAVDRPVPVAIHPAAFGPRYVYPRNGDVVPFYNEALQRLTERDSRGRFVLAEGPVRVAPGTMTTGAIPRHQAFEVPKSTSLYQLRDGEMVPDDVLDDTGLAIVVKDKGLVVLAGCSHAGIINTIHRAMEVTGETRLHAVFGGFHLGFPDTPRDNIDLTIDALEAMSPTIIAPMHCTGWSALRRFAERLSDQLLLMTVGTKVEITA